MNISQDAVHPGFTGIVVTDDQREREDGPYRTVHILGSSTVVFRPEAPLHGRVRAWVETDGPIEGVT